jgi:hypothetical protein
LGFEIIACHIRKHGYVSAVVSGLSASYIRNVRRKCIGAFIVSVNGLAVFTCASITTALAAVAATDDTSLTIFFAPEHFPVHSLPNDSPIHLSVDQLRMIYAICTSAAAGSMPEVSEAPVQSPCEPELSHDDFTLVMHSLNTTVFGIEAEQALGSFSCHKLKLLDNWTGWLVAEGKQLDSMAKQETHGPPVQPPPGKRILRQHWN